MIPLFKVSMDPSAKEQVASTLESGYVGEGPRVKEFEQELSVAMDYPHVLATNSCTSALDMAYHLIGLGDGDTVISSPMTCLATNMPLALRRCIILWADVNRLTGNIDPGSIRDILRVANYRPKAIVCTDWAGVPCDYQAIREAAPGIPIVEDAAHAFGATYRDRPLPVFGGDYVAWSFQAIKHLTTGDGGLLAVPAEMHERARLLRWYGLDRNQSTAMRCLQQASEPGFKYQMNDVAATIGLANLSSAQRHVREHNMNAFFYSSRLPKNLVAPFDRGAAYWIYTILVDDPSLFEERMAKEDIQCSQVHTRNDVQQCLSRAVAFTELTGLDFFQSHMVSIPVGWWLTPGDRERIVRLVRELTKEDRCD